MTERKFVDRIEWCQLPKVGEPGRLLRIVLDVDLSKVQQYIYGQNFLPASGPWPLAMFEEMVDVLTEVARNEQLTADLARMHERGRVG